MPPKKAPHVKGMVSAMLAEMGNLSVIKSKPQKTKPESASEVKAKATTKTPRKPTATEAKTPKTLAPRKKTLKVTESKFGRLGQTKETPAEKDALRKFYCSLLRQKPGSKMAMKWCLERGLIPDDEIEGVVLVLEMDKCKIYA